MPHCYNYLSVESEVSVVYPLMRIHDLSSTMLLLLLPAHSCMLRRELLKKLNNFVHLNLCIALACGLLVFLVGIEGAKSVDVSANL